MNKKITWTIFGILVLMAIGLTIYYLYHPTNPTNIEECKLKAWIDCGLNTEGNQSDWCYQIEGKNSTTYSDCQVISQRTADCWVNFSNFCFNKFIVEPTEKEKDYQSCLKNYAENICSNGVESIGDAIDIKGLKEGETGFVCNNESWANIFPEETIRGCIIK